MMYLGHFSFDQRPPKRGGPWHGLFTLVAEAGSVAAALEKFDALIHDLAAKHDLFNDIDEIYLDSCVELAAVPKKGLLSYVTLREGEDVGGISAALLGASRTHARSYSWGMPPEDDGESRTLEPFVQLTAPAAAAAPPKRRAAKSTKAAKTPKTARAAKTRSKR